MARKSATSSYKNRDNTGFNPFQEAQKIIRFSEQAGRLGYTKFTVFVRDGILEWDQKPPKGLMGFIAHIDQQKLSVGITSKEWRILEDRIAVEMCKQRKAW